MKSDLIDRYVYAVIKKLPPKQRRDLEKELRSLIDDMLLERCGDITPQKHDVRVVLTELGTPSELSQKYRQGGRSSLISEPYYSKYITVLKVVMLSVIFGIAVASLMNFLSGDPWYMATLSWLGNTVIGCAFGACVVTGLFVLFERRGVDLSSQGDNIDNLPPVPQDTDVISKWEPIAGIIVSIIICILMLLSQWVFVAYVSGVPMPIFSAWFIQSNWYVIVGLTAVGVLAEVFKLVEKRYTKRLALAVVAANLISVALAFVLFGNGAIMNPMFLSSMSAITKSEWVLQNINLIVLGAMVLASLLDTIVHVYKALKWETT